MKTAADLAIIEQSKAETARLICGYGGIGRRAGFRIRWATMQVRSLLSAPEKALVFCRCFFQRNKSLQRREIISPRVRQRNFSHLHSPLFRYIALCSKYFVQRLTLFFRRVIFLFGRGERMRRLGRRLWAKACSALARPLLLFSPPKRRAAERKRRGFFCFAKH